MIAGESAGAVTLAALDTGEGTRAVVFVHGWACGAPVWESTLARLPAPYRGVAPDLRGCGDSPGSEATYDFAEYVADLDALADRLHLGRFVIAGNSLGGAIAMRYAHDRPERVAGLVLVGTGAFPNPQSSLLRNNPDIATTGLDPARLREVMRTWSTTLDDPQLDALLERALRTPGPARGRMLARHAATDNRPLLAGIDAPTLVIWGEADQQRSLEEAQYLRDRIAGSELVTIPNASHCTFIDAPDAFVAHLVAFMERRARW